MLKILIYFVGNILIILLNGTWKNCPDQIVWISCREARVRKWTPSS